MSATRRFLVGFVVALCLATAGTANAYHTRFIKWDSSVRKPGAPSRNGSY
jgi:hypothetical protein